MAFNTLEKKALTGLALLYASRMLGLFMVLPILTLYGQSLTGATTVLLGIALGIYGITQAILQIPLGMLSDRFGRKPVIAAGLLIFIVGSVIAALSDHVLGVVIGRALQGAGAIASVILALLADYTRPEERTKAMAIVGAIIGGSFVLAVIIGPVIASAFGLSGVFWATSLMALAGLVIVYWLPAPPPARVHEERRWQGSQLGPVIRDRQLVPLNLGVFVLHLTMTMMFVGLPVVLVQQGILGDQLGWVYAPVMVLSFLGMVPMIALAERRKAHRLFLILAGAFIIAAMAGLGLSTVAWLSIGLVWLFFVGFNFVEASLPSLISRRAPENARGTAMGVFSTGQFLGAALGGLSGGWAYQQWGMAGIAMIGIAAMLVWMMLLWALGQGVPGPVDPKTEASNRPLAGDDPNMTQRS
ncbi:MFS transporter [Saccharospirillum impatiens]|uniref:MFS transporter n=1 Tax=Saccharospirillum impatiens TaxID=169438 RepID=UPI0003FCB11D|nr:MFS transporter [Saccharospirillum impatiens]